MTIRGDWYICRTTDDDGFIVWKDKKVREILRGVYRAQAHAAGEGGAEKRTVHDGEDTHGGERNGLLQDTALESDFEIGCT